MGELNMLVWLTQLGLSVAIPLAGFTLAGVWLRSRFDLGVWVVVCFCALGMKCAFDGLRSSLKMMEQMEKQRDKAQKKRASGTGSSAKDKGGK
jgi:hypothetical protein